MQWLFFSPHFLLYSPLLIPVALSSPCYVSRFALDLSIGSFPFASLAQFFKMSPSSPPSPLPPPLSWMLPGHGLQACPPFQSQTYLCTAGLTWVSSPETQMHRLKYKLEKKNKIQTMSSSPTLFLFLSTQLMIIVQLSTLEKLKTRERRHLCVRSVQSTTLCTCTNPRWRSS